MTNPSQLYTAPGETVQTDSGTEALTMEIDPSSSNRVHVCAFEDDEYRVGLYLTPEDALAFADALTLFAAAARGKEGPTSVKNQIAELEKTLTDHEAWESEPVEARTVSGSWIDVIDVVREIKGNLQ